MHVGWDELHPGGWDPKARLLEQDRDGVAAEVLYPSIGMLLCNHPDGDYKKACFDAYNLWIAEFQAEAPARLVGVGQTALRSVEEGVADLARIRELGLRGVMLPGIPACVAEGDYDHLRWDPFWRAAIEIGLPLSFHILTSGSDQLGSSSFRGPKMNAFLGIIRGCQDIIGTLQTFPAQGSTNVKEVALEFLVPLLADKKGAKRLEINLGGRSSDYETAGRVETYKADGLWEPFNGFTFRGGFEHAIRAPNIGELYNQAGAQAQIGSPPGAGDPCDTRSTARTSRSSAAPTSVEYAGLA